MNDFFAFSVLASSGILLHLIESFNFGFLRLLVFVFENVILLSVKTVVDNQRIWILLLFIASLN